MDNNYSLIVYKPNSSDYCRGCHMASYSSDFGSYFCQTREQVTELAAEFKKRNEFLLINEAGYDFLILKDGRVFLDDDNRVADYGNFPDDTKEENELKDMMRDDIHKLSRILINQEKERLQNEVNHKNKLELEKKKKEEKALYNQLKTKYG